MNKSPERRRRCVQEDAVSFLFSWKTYRAPDNLLLGCRPGIRKDKPEGTEPLSGQKEVVGRVAHDVRGASLSSPVRAEQVVSHRKTLQTLVCRVWGFPSVGLQTGSVCR